jgi:spore protease
MLWRTDLAAERCAAAGELPEGVSRGGYTFEGIEVETVDILTEGAAEVIGKPRGRYITVTTPGFASSREVSDGELEKIAGELRGLLPGSGTVLVAGLGNNDITPDAVGPRCAHQIIATRHIGPGSAREAGLGALRGVAAVAPGVLGQTGIEASSLVHALCKEIKPCAVIAIDALAARSVSRLGNTIQLANTGISPGAGVQNARKELSAESLGVPVVSIGVPTVVDAATLAADLLGCGEEGLEAKRGIFRREGREMMVTTRDIDQLIGHACRTLALAINRAVQKELSLEVISYLMS